MVDVKNLEEQTLTIQRTRKEDGTISSLFTVSLSSGKYADFLGHDEAIGLVNVILSEMGSKGMLQWLRTKEEHDRYSHHLSNIGKTVPVYDSRFDTIRLLTA